MRICRECERTENETRIINSSEHGMVCNRCYQRKKRGVDVYPLPALGEIKYSPKGLPICHICGEAHNRLMKHVQQVHKITAKEYKKKFSLETVHGIIPNESRKKLQEHVRKNYEKVVVENLIIKGKKTRFTQGHEGRTKAKVSLMTLKKLRENIKSTPTHSKHK